MQPAKRVTKPPKQRKMLWQAMKHERHRRFTAILSPDLRGSHGVKTMPIRSGDTVRVMRGDHKGFEGKVSKIFTQRYRILVDGLTREKADGTSIFVPVHPSKVMITKLELKDNWRRKILERRKTQKELIEIPEEPSKKERPKKERTRNERGKKEPKKDRKEREPGRAEKPKRKTARRKATGSTKGGV